MRVFKISMLILTLFLNTRTAEANHYYYPKISGNYVAAIKEDSGLKKSVVVYNISTDTTTIVDSDDSDGDCEQRYGYDYHDDACSGVCNGENIEARDLRLKKGRIAYLKHPYEVTCELRDDVSVINDPYDAFDDQLFKRVSYYTTSYSSTYPAYVYDINTEIKKNVGYIGTTQLAFDDDHLCAIYNTNDYIRCVSLVDGEEFFDFPTGGELSVSSFDISNGKIARATEYYVDDPEIGVGVYTYSFIDLSSDPFGGDSFFNIDSFTYLNTGSPTGGRVCDSGTHCQIALFNDYLVAPLDIDGIPVIRLYNLTENTSQDINIESGNDLVDIGLYKGVRLNENPIVVFVFKKPTDGFGDYGVTKWQNGTKKLISSIDSNYKQDVDVYGAYVIWNVNTQDGGWQNYKVILYNSLTGTRTTILD